MYIQPNRGFVNIVNEFDSLDRLYLFLKNQLKVMKEIKLDPEYQILVQGRKEEKNMRYILDLKVQYEYDQEDT